MEWQPIKTAPTSGPPREIVILIDGNDPELVYAPFYTRKGRVSSISVETGNIRYLERATHWLSLPDLPQ